MSLRSLFYVFRRYLNVFSKMLIKIYFQIQWKKEMQKNGQMLGSQRISCCSFCYSPSEEIRIIMRASLIRLRKMFQSKKHFESTEVLDKKDKIGLSRLLRVLFERHQFELKLSKSCGHQPLHNLLCLKLHCRPEQLETLLEQLCDRLARRNYQLQIIASQIKNVQHSAIELQEGLELLSQKRQSTICPQDVREQVRRQSVPEEEVKVQQLQGKPIYEVSPTTGLNYNISFEEMPFNYNVLFYGGQYYQ